MLPRVLAVTGTDTGVGKTIATAGLAVTLHKLGRRIAVYKPCQTGAAIGDSDVREITRLSGVGHVEAGIVLREPMAPVPAARLDGVELPTIAHHVHRIRELAEAVDHVLVEGAGGLLVELDAHGGTLADIAADPTIEAAIVVVARSGLGTLNHTALTLEVLERRGIRVLGSVIGSWPVQPSLIESSNRREFEHSRYPLLACVPAQSGDLSGTDFQEAAPHWFDGLSP